MGVLLLQKIMTHSPNPKSATFTPTAAMIEAAETLFLALAHEQCIRPVVEAYQRKILSERTWRCAPEILERAQRRASDEPMQQHVTDIKLAWTMEKADFAHYIKRCNEERIAAGLVVESDSHCPLLVAEDLTRKAKYALCDAMVPITGISADDALRLRHPGYDEFVDLNLSQLAPFIKDPLALLGR